MGARLKLQRHALQRAGAPAGNCRMSRTQCVLSTLHMLRALPRLPRPPRPPRAPLLAPRPPPAAGAAAETSGPGQLAQALRKQRATSPFIACDRAWAGGRCVLLFGMRGSRACPSGDSRNVRQLKQHGIGFRRGWGRERGSTRRPSLARKRAMSRPAGAAGAGHAPAACGPAAPAQ